MSGDAYGTGSGSGSTARGGGQTTSVQLRGAGLDPQDKKVVCKAVCVCSREPDEGASGQSLKQQCVSRNLRDVDRAMDTMRTEQVRRIPIVDERGSLVGIIAQADIVRKARDDAKAQQTVEDISEPGGRHSR